MKVDLNINICKVLLKGFLQISEVGQLNCHSEHLLLQQTTAADTIPLHLSYNSSIPLLHLCSGQWSGGQLVWGPATGWLPQLLEKVVNGSPAPYACLSPSSGLVHKLAGRKCYFHSTTFFTHSDKNDNGKILPPPPCGAAWKQGSLGKLNNSGDLQWQVEWHIDWSILLSHQPHYEQINHTYLRSGPSSCAS